jgi:osmotically-inducible protein OsmY
MANPNVKAARSDSQIQSAINKLMKSYPPLAHDRHRIQTTVADGTVTITGYVKAMPTYTYVRNNLSRLNGIQQIDAKEFFNDEALRLDIGRAVPSGVQVVVEYGAVILAGKLPAGTTAEDVVRKVALVPGVHRVLTTFD